MSKMRNQSAENFPARISSVSPNKKNIIYKVFAVLSALLVWQFAAMLIDSKLLLVSPADVAVRLVGILGEEGFSSVIVFTFSRIVIGFFSGLMLGILLALLAGRFKFIEILLWPYMLTIRSVPVASFVVLALIWLTSSNLAAFISFLMVLPIVYINLLEGIRSVDKKMLEMAEVFRMNFCNRIRFIWLPAVRPFLLSACRVSLGLAWKSGVAAELIGYPDGSVGEALYYSKLYLDTASLFAWTVIIVLLSVCFEKLFMLLLNKVLKGAEKL